MSASLALALVSLAAATPVTPLQRDLSNLVGVDRALDAADLASLEDAGVLRRLGTPGRAHRGAARALWLGDGETFASITRDGEAVRWDAETGERVAATSVMAGRSSMPVVDVASTGDGGIVALVSGGGVLALDPKTLEPIGKPKKTGDLRGFVRSPDGGVVVGLPAEGAGPDRATVVDTARARTRRGPELPGSVLALAVSDGAERIATIVRDGDRPRVAVIDARGREVGEDALKAYRRGAGPSARAARSVALSPDGEALAIGGRGVVTVVDLERGDLWFDADVGAGPVTFLAYEAGRALLVGTDDGTVAVLDPRSGDVRVQRGLHGAAVVDVRPDADQRRIVSVDERGGVRLLDVGTGEEIHGTGWLAGPIGAVAFSPGGGTVVAGGAAGNLAASIGGEEAKIAPKRRHRGPILELAVVDERRILSVARGEVPQYGPLAGGEPEVVPEGATEAGAVVAADYQPETYLLSLGYDSGVHQLHRMEQATTQQGTPWGIRAVAASPNENHYAILSTDRVLAIVDRNLGDYSNDELDRAPSEATRRGRVGIEFLDDKTLAIVKDDDTLEIVGLDGRVTGKVDMRSDPGAPVTGSAFARSRFGQWVVTERPGEGLIVFDVRKNERVGVLRYDAGGATSVAVSDDDSRVAFGQADGTTLVWDVDGLLKWFETSQRTDRYAPVVSAMDAAPDRYLAAEKSVKDADLADHHRLRGWSAMRFLPPSEQRGELRANFAKKLSKSLGTEAFDALCADVAKEWVGLGRAYARRDAALLALECARAADVWQPGAGDPVRKSAGFPNDGTTWEPAPEPVEVVEDEPEEEEPAIQIPLAKAASRNCSTLPDGAIRIPGSVASGRAVLSSKPAVFTKVGTVARFEVDGGIVVGALVGVSTRGEGGYAVVASFKGRGKQLELSLFDRKKNERLGLRRYTLEDAPTEHRIDVEIEDGKIVGTWNGLHSVRGAARKKVKGRVGFEVLRMGKTGGGAIVTAIETDPAADIVEPKEASDERPGNTTFELPLDERLGRAEAALGDGGDGASAALAEIHRLRFDVERLGDEAARQAMVARIDALEEANDPLAARRGKALTKIADLLATRAESAASGGRPMAALALFDLALVRDDAGVRPRFEAIATQLAPALAMRRGVPKEEPAALAPPEASLLADSFDPYEHEWTTEKGETTVAIGPQQVAFLVTREQYPAEDLDVSVQLRSGGDEALGLFLGVDPGWSLISVQRRMIGRDCALLLLRWNAGKWTRLAGTRIRFSEEAAADWMTMRVRYASAKRELSVLLGAADPWVVTLEKAIKAGRVGVVAVSNATGAKPRFRGLTKSD